MSISSMWLRRRRRSDEITIWISAGGVGSSTQEEEEGHGHGECCRVCYMSVDLNSISGEATKLGCACKDDLALVHRKCAEAWFKIKGDR